MNIKSFRHILIFGGIALSLITLPGHSQQRPDISSCNSEENPDQRIRKCTEYIERGAFLAPEFSWAYMKRGTAYAQKKNHDRAIQDFDRSVQEDPKNASALMDRGLSYAAQGNYDHAIEDLNESIRLDSSEALAYTIRGLLYNNKGDYDHAIQDLD